MATTAEVHGFGARAPYAQPRASEYDMKERVRLSGLFPRVRNQPMSTQLQALLKEFENNAALTGILERRRRFEERRQFELQGSEAMEALNTNLAPPFRAGLARAATSAAVAQRIADFREETARQAAQAAAAANVGAAPTAAAVMTGGPGVSQIGGSSGSGTGVFGEPPIPVLGAQFSVVAPGTPVAAKGRAKKKAAPGTPAVLPATPGGRRKAPRTPPGGAQSSSQA